MSKTTGRGYTRGTGVSTCPRGQLFLTGPTGPAPSQRAEPVGLNRSPRAPTPILGNRDRNLVRIATSFASVDRRDHVEVLVTRRHGRIRVSQRRHWRGVQRRAAESA